MPHTGASTFDWTEQVANALSEQRVAAFCTYRPVSQLDLYRCRQQNASCLMVDRTEFWFGGPVAVRDCFHISSFRQRLPCKARCFAAFRSLMTMISGA